MSGARFVVTRWIPVSDLHGEVQMVPVSEKQDQFVRASDYERLERVLDDVETRAVSANKAISASEYNYSSQLTAIKMYLTNVPLGICNCVVLPGQICAHRLKTEIYKILEQEFRYD